MTDQTSLTKRIEAVIGEHLAAKGGGFMEGFTAIVDTIDADGETVVYIVTPSAQRLHRSIGLSHYLAKYFEREGQHLWDAAHFTEDEEEDE